MMKVDFDNQGDTQQTWQMQVKEKQSLSTTTVDHGFTHEQISIGDY